MAATAHQQLPQVGFVRLPQILAVVPVSRSTWWAWVKSGKAPASRKLGPKITVWEVEKIRAFLSSI